MTIIGRPAGEKRARNSSTGGVFCKLLHLVTFVRDFGVWGRALWSRSGGTPEHGFPPDIAMTAPAPGGGGGGRRPGRVGSMRCADLRELETGEGETPSPSAPPPMAIATTVHCMRTCVVRHQPHQGKGEDQNRVSTKPIFVHSSCVAAGDPLRTFV